MRRGKPERNQDDILFVARAESGLSRESALRCLRNSSALRGASERLAPILVAALVTNFGLLPLPLGSGNPGREVEGPMAVVILGGLVTSTALDLL